MQYNQPENHKFGGGATETMLHPIVLVALLIVVVLILILPRKYVIVPVLFITFLTPLPQQLLLGGLHIFVLRIVVLTGCVRIFVTRFLSAERTMGGGWNSLDTAFVLWASFRAVAFVLLYLNSSALVNQFGFLWDAFGGYFLLRFLIQDQEDMLRSIKCLAILVVILGAAMLNEQRTGHNIFAVLGGVPNFTSGVRDGRIRSQSVFQHPLLAGAFGATLFPLFILLRKFSKAKVLSVIAMISSVVMAYTSATSTSIMTLGAGIFGLLFWPFRKQMRKLRWGIVIGLLALQLVMHAPVWWAISHIDLTGGSSSYQRAALVDKFIRNFPNWCLVGTNDAGTWGWDMWDTCNQYVQEGEDGGLATLACFLALIVISFRRLGNARKAVEGDSRQEAYYWILGSALFSHVIGYLGISYFDQTRFAWFAFLAMISVCTLSSQTSPAVEGTPIFGPQSASLLGMQPSSFPPNGE